MAFQIRNTGKVTGPIPGYIIPAVADRAAFLRLDCLADERSNHLVLAYLYAFANEPSIKGAFQGGAATQAEIVGHIAAMVTPAAGGVFTPPWAEKAAPNVQQGNLASIVIGLISAAKKKDLDTEHMSSYYASLGVTNISCGKICKLINSMKVYYPEVTSIPGYDAIRLDNLWQDYRENLTSWQSILKKCEASMIECNVLAKAEYDRLMAVDCKHQANIGACPQKVLFALATHLEAADRFPSRWYQGKKALDEADPKRVLAAVKGWKKYFDFCSSLVHIENAQDKAQAALALSEILM